MHIKLFFLLGFSLLLQFSDIVLEKRTLLDGKIEILIPEDFEQMDEEIISVKYPAANRPNLVLSNEATTVNVAFNHTTNKMDEESLVEFHQYMVQTFESVYSEATWFSKEMVEVNGRQLGKIELMTPALDTDIYNLMFFTNVDGRLLICSFNCTKELKDDWMPVAQKILNSLRVQ